MDISEFFKGFTTERIEVDYRNRDAIEIFLKMNVAKLAYESGNKIKYAVVTSNPEFISRYKKETGKYTNRITLITKNPNKQRGLEIKTYDMLTNNTFSIPLKHKWKFIEWVTITEEYQEEIISRMASVYSNAKNNRNYNKNDENNKSRV